MQHGNMCFQVEVGLYLFCWIKRTSLIDPPSLFPSYSGASYRDVHRLWLRFPGQLPVCPPQVKVPFREKINTIKNNSQFKQLQNFMFIPTQISGHHPCPRAALLYCYHQTKNIAWLKTSPNTSFNHALCRFWWEKAVKRRQRPVL